MLTFELTEPFIFWFMQHRCMQPKDSPEKTPNSDKRMKKKLDKLMKGFVSKQPSSKFFFQSFFLEINNNQRMEPVISLLFYPQAQMCRPSISTRRVE